MNELALFAGCGGVLPGKLLGWTTVCAVEIDPFARSVLLARQRDGSLHPPFPIWTDVRTFDGRPWRGIIDVITGGFPCQDISTAGKGAGLAGSRSSLWHEMLRIIEEVRPTHVLAENSPSLRTRGLGTIIQGLTSLGYDVRWGVLGAWHAGEAPHKRNRMWIYAHATNADITEVRHESGWRNGSGGQGEVQPTNNGKAQQVAGLKRGSEAWRDQPGVSRVVDGVADRVEYVARLTAIGNGQVPQTAALAWRILSGSHGGDL